VKRTGRLAHAQADRPLAMEEKLCQQAQHQRAPALMREFAAEHLGRARQYDVIRRPRADPGLAAAPGPFSISETAISNRDQKWTRS
jgi:hypothetical protein